MDKWLIKKDKRNISKEAPLPNEEEEEEAGPSNTLQVELELVEEAGPSTQIQPSHQENPPDLIDDQEREKENRDRHVRNYKFNQSWLNNRDWKKWLSEGGVDGKTNHELAFCNVCQSKMLAHSTTIKNHASSNKHKKLLTQVCSNKKITQSFQTKHIDNSVKLAELKLCGLLATNNLPFTLMDTLCPLLPQLFPDSDIARRLNLHRTKATVYTTEILGKEFLTELYNKLKIPNNFFSLIMDETTDLSVKKQCAFSIIYFDDQSNTIQIQFFDLVEIEDGGAIGLFNSLKNAIETKSIPLSNLIGFCSDTTNVMAGENHSVFALLKKEIPNIINVKCSCHLIHLAASKACTHLPRSVEDMLRNIGSHFSRSPSRVKKFEEFQIFFKIELHKILSPANTRWLSLKQCIDRVIEQYSALKAYFRITVFEDPSVTTETILLTMDNRFTLIYLEFMSYSLGLLTDFNLLFQTDQPLLYKVKFEVEILLKTICFNYMNKLKVKSKNIFQIDHRNPRDFVNLKDIYLGVGATQSLNLIKDQEGEVETFLKTILNFYLELVSQIKNRFTFTDPIYDILDIVDPQVSQSFKYKSLNPILDRFPVLKNVISDAQLLDNEWRKYSLLDFESLELPSETEKYWKCIFELSNPVGEALFPNVKKVISFLLILPFSNVKVERIFSELNNIKTENRNCLSTSTIRGILGAKEGIKREGNLTNFTPTKAMIRANPVYGKKNSEFLKLLYCKICTCVNYF